MTTIQIPEADLLKAEEIFSDTGACYSVFPRNVHVVSDETFEALKAGGVRVRRKPPSAARPPWLQRPGRDGRKPRSAGVAAR